METVAGYIIYSIINTITYSVNNWINNKMKFLLLHSIVAWSVGPPMQLNKKYLYIGFILNDSSVWDKPSNESEKMVYIL